MESILVKSKQLTISPSRTAMDQSFIITGDYTKASFKTILNTVEVFSCTQTTPGMKAILRMAINQEREGLLGATGRYTMDSGSRERNTEVGCGKVLVSSHTNHISVNGFRERWKVLGSTQQPKGIDTKVSSRTH